MAAGQLLPGARQLGEPDDRHEGRILQQGDPQEVYHRPSSRYVAEFFGKTNFIDATASPAGQGRLNLATRDGDIAGVAAHGGVAAGPVVCAIRPEAWRIDPSGRIRGKVAERTFIGDRQELVVDTALGPQTVVLLGFQTAKVGDEVNLSVDPQRVHLLPASR